MTVDYLINGTDTNAVEIMLEKLPQSKRKTVLEAFRMMIASMVD